MYLSLQQPFVPCYGVGNSVFLQRQVARFSRNDEILKCPYPVRLEGRGWSPTRYWADGLSLDRIGRDVSRGR